ncbi:RNA chaperone Hfq [Armatimonas rosea]|uniref:RNA chaperone Hfq n=1 Tax=Armatimonas rosea TaxID=685828 RepID=A0A7W9SPW8_ARMRO|nr:RNA chaperone Hfq [Armatimonas rosea]MBB6050636.1 RNA chaperone Hfq [Armatimonas rosea]
MDFGPSRDRMPTIQLSSAAMIRLRDEHATLAFLLVNGQTLTGQVKWFDDFTINVLTTEGREITLQKHAVIYYHVA